MKLTRIQRIESDMLQDIKQEAIKAGVSLDRIVKFYDGFVSEYRDIIHLSIFDEGTAHTYAIVKIGEERMWIQLGYYMRDQNEQSAD